MCRRYCIVSTFLVFGLLASAITADEAPGPGGGGLEREEAARRGPWQRQWYGQEWSPEYRDQVYDVAVFQRMVFAHKFELAPSMRAATLISEAAPGSTWVNVGPAGGSLDYDVTEGGTRYTLSLAATDSGRLSEIVPHPFEPDTVFVVSAGGGLWLTQDGGQTWEPRTDSEPTLALSALAIDPVTLSTLYLGLGDLKEAAFGGTGVGLIKSTDGGRTWAKPVIPGAARVVTTLLVDPMDNKVVLAGTDRGLFRSIDAGASFQSVSLPLGTSRTIEDLTWAGGDRIILAAGDSWLDPAPNGGADLLLSTDRGKTWSSVAGLGNRSEYLAFTVAAAPSDRSRLYAMASRLDYELAEIFTSSDHGASWTAIGARAIPYANPNPESPGLAVLLGEQGGYNQMVIVDPRDPEVVYFGGRDVLIRSTDGGATFTVLSDWRGNYGLPYLHPDFQCAAFTASGALWVGTDGGLAKSTDGGETWSTTVNRGLSTHFVYKISSTPTAPDVVVAGLQDNGTRIRVGGTADFTQRVYADGFGVVVHPLDTEQILSSVYYTRILKSTDGGVSYASSYADIAEAGKDDEAPFYTQLVPSPSDLSGNTVYTFTNRTIYRSTDFGDSWTSIPVPSFRGPLRHLGVAPSHGNILGVVAEAGEILLSEDGGATWKLAAGSLPNSAGALSHIAFSPLDPRTVYVASVAPVKTASHLWKSTDWGATWAAIDKAANFPRGVPVNVMIGDPLDADALYAGTHLGLYESLDGGMNWTRFGFGLPLVSVTDVYISPDSKLVRVATFGRGVWELAP